jgi:hypothetical protein
MKNDLSNDCNRNKARKTNSVSGGIYGLGFIGALVYYIQHAPTFWVGLLGFLKALVWPAFLIYKIMEHFKM